MCSACHVNYPDVVEFCPNDGNRLPPGRFQEVPAPEETIDPLIGTTIDGRYIVESVLGQGGMGFVYGARHAIIDKRVAIKVLRNEFSQDESAVERFLVEAKAASRIGHQNIVDITDYGVLPAGNNAYFVMEFLDGPTLGKVMSEAGHLSPIRAIAITVQIARGLLAAHDKGIIHRDLKPENVFVLTRDGQDDVIKIVDFGIARDVSHKKRLTQAGMVLGTPEYMAPEQASGQPTDHRVDLYALGCMLYEMLCGEVPFKGETPTKTLTMHVFDRAVPLSERSPQLAIPPALESVCMRMIEKKPADRFSDLRAVMSELERVDHQLRGLRPASPRPKTPPTTIVDPIDELPLKSKKPIVILAALGLLIAAGVALAMSGKKPLEASGATAGAGSAPKAAPSPIPARAPAAIPALVEVALHSEPAGADVFDGSERLGVTPLRIKRARADRPFELSFRRSGYHDSRKTLVPDRDLDLEVLLVAKRDRPPVRPSGPKSRSAPAQKAAIKAPPPPRKPQSDLRNPFD